MKIAYLLSTLLHQSPTEGGHSQQLHIISELLRHGHHVTVYARSDESPVAYSHDLTGWQPVDLKVTGGWLFRKTAGAVWKLQRAFGVPYLNVFRNIQMLEACVRILPEYDLCFERVGLYSVAPALACKWRRKPYVLFFDADGLFELDYAGTPITGIQRYVVSWMQRTSLRQAECIVCVSEVSKKLLIDTWHIDGQNVHVLPNAVDICQFHSLGSEDCARIRGNFGLREDAIITMFVGSFQSWHDWRGLIQAFQLVTDEVPNSLLVLVGDGPYRNDAEVLVRSLGLSAKAIFLGAVPHRMVNSVLGAADVVVAPYPKDHHEFWGSPMKIFEYMASGKATVAASVGQLTEILQHGKTALLYEPGDIHMLAAHIVELSTLPALRQDIGRNAREQAVREYSWDTYVHTLDGILKKAIARNTLRS